MIGLNDSVAKVLTKFNKMIDDLSAIAKREEARQASLTDQQNRLRDHKLVSIEEQANAERIAKKLSDLIK